MTNDDVFEHISSLVAKEHELLDGGDNEHALGKVQIELDRYWDLLRRRRAAAASGENTDEAGLRDEETVENYRP